MSADPGAIGGGPGPGGAAGGGGAGGPGGGGGSGGPGGPGGPGGQPSEEELRAAYEAELARITSADMMLQAAVSLLNIGSYRLAPGPPVGAEGGAPGGGAGAATGDGQDLEQVRDSIDGVRALVEILERRVPGGELRPLRDALSQLQMAYAREVQAGGGAAEGAGDPGSGEGGGGSGGGGSGNEGDGDGARQQPPGGQDKPGPGPAESSGRLWVPGR